MGALGFFRTDEDRRASTQQSATARHSRQVNAAPQRISKPNGHAVPPSSRATAKSGVSLRLKDKEDDLDKGFERY
jgi:hypothetical protein